MARTVSSIIDRYRAGAISAEIAVMELLIAHEDASEVARLVAGVPPLLALCERHAAGANRIAAMLRTGPDTSEPAASVEAGIAHARTLFDWSVQQSEEASVALYSLGSAEVLERATAELVALYVARGWVRADRAILQIGCGIGRLEHALSPLVREAHGIDVSPKMIDAARRRCADLSNVTFAVTDGRDLQAYPDARFDLVHAIDTFPYLVQAGMPLVETHMREAARVLVPGGDLVIGNWSYRDDRALDLADLERCAELAGLAVVSAGERPLALWNGVLFHLRRYGT